MIVCCDAGGTSVRFAWARSAHEVSLRKKYEVKSFPSGEGGFLSALMQYFREAEVASLLPNMEVLIVSAAGPSRGSEIRFTNSDWVVKHAVVERNLRDALKRPIRVVLLNDYEALAYGVPALKSSDLSAICLRETKGDTSIVCGAGTGLGLAAVKRIGPGPLDVVVLATEGGHQSFPAETGVEREICESMLDDRVSYEHILSGDGLQILYNFFARRNNQPYLKELSPQEIMQHYANGNVAALQALEAFGNILGSFCGNMVLALGATGGVYLWGGILKEFPIELLKRNMLRRFHDRGRAADYVANVPVYRIVNDKAALRGCSIYCEKFPE